MGELGWSLDRYLHATVDEFNKSAAGYWRNWERNTAWLMREISYVIVAGNPYIKSEDKPRRSSDIYSISDDKEVKDDKPKAPTAKEIEEVKQFFKDKLNGIAQGSDSKDKR